MKNIENNVLSDKEKLIYWVVITGIIISYLFLLYFFCKIQLKEPVGKVLGELFVFVVFLIFFFNFYINYYLSKLLFMLEFRRVGKLSDFIADVFLLFIYPVAIFFVQPRVNKACA